MLIRGRSSVGRALALQAGGRRFDPVQLHQTVAREVASDERLARSADKFRSDIAPARII